MNNFYEVFEISKTDTKTDGNFRFVFEWYNDRAGTGAEIPFKTLEEAHESAYSYYQHLTEKEFLNHSVYRIFEIEPTTEEDWDEVWMASDLWVKDILWQRGVKKSIMERAADLYLVLGMECDEEIVQRDMSIDYLTEMTDGNDDWLHYLDFYDGGEKEGAIRMSDGLIITDSDEIYELLF